MESKEVDVGIYRITLTVYKTGNVHVCFVNRMNGETRKLKVRNPLAFQNRANAVSYRV